MNEKGAHRASGGAIIYGMGDVIAFKKRSPKDKNQGKTLCLHNFHKWKVVTEKKFDVKQGRLVTVLRCERCGQEKTRLT